MTCAGHCRNQPCPSPFYCARHGAWCAPKVQDEPLADPPAPEPAPVAWRLPLAFAATLIALLLAVHFLTK